MARFLFFASIKIKIHCFWFLELEKPTYQNEALLEMVYLSEHFTIQNYLNTGEKSLKVFFSV